MGDNEKIDVKAQISDLLQDLEDLLSRALQCVICLKVLTNPGDINEFIKELEATKKQPLFFAFIGVIILRLTCYQNDNNVLSK